MTLRDSARLVFWSVATLCLFAATACQAQPPLGSMERTTGTLNLPGGGICSATVYSRKAIITASHCLVGVKAEVRFRGINYRVVQMIHDGKDHALVIVDGDLGRAARRGPNARVGETLWMFGNPMGLPQMLRQGIVAKVTPTETFLDCRCWNGDSGM